MIKIFKVFIKLFFSLILGFAIAISLLQQDSWSIDTIESVIIDSFSNSMDVNLSFRLKEVNLLAGKIIVEDITCVSKDNNWKFESHCMVFKFSWFSLITSFVSYQLLKIPKSISKFINNSANNESYALNYSIIFYNPKIFSIYKNGNLSIFQGLKKFLSINSIFPLKFVKCGLRQATLNVNEGSKEIDTILLFSSDISSIPTGLSLNITLVDGIIKHKAIIFAQKFLGTSNININSNYDIEPSFINSSIAADFLASKANWRRFNLMLNYKNHMGIAEFKSIDDNCSIIVPKFSFKDKFVADFKINTSLSMVADYFNIKQVSGNSSIDGNLIFSNNRLNYNCLCKIDSFKYGYFAADKIEIEAKGDAINHLVATRIINGMKADIDCKWRYNSNNKQLVCAGNIINQWSVFDKRLSVDTLTFNIFGDLIEWTNPKINIDYETKLGLCFKRFIDQGDFEKYKTKGKISIDKEQISVKGQIDTIKDKKRRNESFIEKGSNFTQNMIYDATFDLKPFSIVNLKLIADEKNIVNLSRTKYCANGQIDFVFIRKLIKSIFNYDLSGEAILDLECKLINNCLIINLMSKGIIKLPYNYNLIKNIKGVIEIDLNKYTVSVKGLDIELNKGKISSNLSTLIFSDKYQLDFIHIPLVIYDCLVGWKKIFFANVSGALTLTISNKGISLCKGDLTLDKSYLRGNLFSSKLQSDIMGDGVKSLNTFNKDILLDINLATKQYTNVTTPFLNTNLFCNLMLKGTISNPELSGLIELKQGALAFPYKPLYITSGKIYVNAHQLSDPGIELIAKNRLKKYNITLRVSGSIKQPKIVLESSGNLTNEQILSLLLSGSEDGSLYLVMPNMLMQNLESLLFDSVEAYSESKSSLKSILKPLKNIRITPILTESNSEVQSALEVDINDKLTAKIQNNLDLSASKMEMEYALTDDISIKGIKDDKGQLGAELQMKWKF